jgi:ABC-type branched-subunit amino acid transport system ATPase component
MDASFEMTLLMVITIVAGIGAQVCAEFFKVPSIVFLLSFGILLGQDGLEIIRPSLLGNGLEVIVGLSVALILFEGGLSLELRELGKVSGSLRNLVTIGTMVTLLGGGMAAHWLSEFPWTIAFLYASIVVVTGPTVVGPLLKQVKVNRQVSTLLEGEGVLIDPVGAILAVVVLDFILNGSQATAPLTVLSGLTLRLGIGHCPEGRRLLGRQTVARNLELGAYLRRDQEGIRQDLERCYQLFPRLAERRQQLAGALSGGEQQMLAIARSLMGRPTLLMLDEPSLGLAPRLVAEVMAVLADLHQQGQTILLVEQNAQAALEIADRGYVLEAGRRTLEGRASELLGNPALRAAYLGSP